MYYEDGTPKTDDPSKGVYDLSIAKLLIEHKANTRDYYEFIPIEGSLQTSYNEFVSLLEGQGITRGSSEFKKKVKEWEKQNLRMVYTDEYYAERTRILTRIQELQGKMNAVMDSEFNVGDAYKKISDLIFSYRDEQGQPMSSELGEDKLKMIRDTQHIRADLYMHGHNHRCDHFSVPTMHMGIEGREIGRKHYVFTGSFLKYIGYAESMLLPILPEAFIQLNINKDFRLRSNQFNIDETKPEYVELG